MDFDNFNTNDVISQLTKLEKLAERQISILQRRVVDTEAAYIEDSRLRNGNHSVLTGWEGYMDRKAGDLVSTSSTSKYRGTAEDRIFSRSSVLSDYSQNHVAASAFSSSFRTSSSSSSLT